MSETDSTLLRWMHRRAANLDKATLGQLATLLELVSAESVAAMGKKIPKEGAGVSAGVNYRQKLARLEEALGVGELTRRAGKFTRPTETGIRVAAELRLFLQELRAIETRKAEFPTWLIGAGDAWLHSAIVPALVELAQSHPRWRWEVKNLRSRDIRTGLRDGQLHFGFIRLGETGTDDFTQGTKVNIASYRIVLGKAKEAPSGAKEMILWAIAKGRPLVQQGSTWNALGERAGKALQLSKQLSHLNLQVTCETHPQAVAAAESGQSWCIVPDILGRVLVGNARSAVFDAGPNRETMVLVNYSRALKKHAEADIAWEELNRAIRRVAAEG